MELDRSIFRAYDIRGVYGKTLDEGVMRDVGRAVGTIMLRKKLGNEIVVGNDVRASSPALSKAFIEGVRSMGVNVTDVGTTSFGLAVFSGWRTKKDVTAYVTASHNPPEWNGIKFFDRDCVGWFEADNKEIGRIVADADFEPQAKAGELRTAEMKGEYIAHLKGKFSFSKRLKVVVDCGNGSTALVVPELLASIGNVDADMIFNDVDPNFAGRGADIEKENLEKLCERVRATGAGMGVAFDGDGDRIAVVDDKGRILGAEQTMVMLGREMLGGDARNVIANVECSMAVERMLVPLGANVVRIPVGHTFMMQAARDHGAVFGGESSCHYVIPSYFPFDDGAVTALKMIEIVAKSGRRLSELVDSIPAFPKERVNIDCADATKFKVVEALKGNFRGKFARVNTMDGVRVELDNGWALIRPSNTSATIRLTVEATDGAQLKKLKADFRPLIEAEIAKAV
jgi:phosphomannomutase